MSRKIIAYAILVSGVVLLAVNLPGYWQEWPGYNRFVYDGTDFVFAWIGNFILISFYFWVIFGPIIYLLFSKKKKDNH